MFKIQRCSVLSGQWRSEKCWISDLKNSRAWINMPKSISQINYLVAFTVKSYRFQMLTLKCRLMLNLTLQKKTNIQFTVIYSKENHNIFTFKKLKLIFSVNTQQISSTLMVCDHFSGCVHRKSYRVQKHQNIQFIVINSKEKQNFFTVKFKTPDVGEFNVNLL